MIPPVSDRMFLSDAGGVFIAIFLIQLKSGGLNVIMCFIVTVKVRTVTKYSRKGVTGQTVAKGTRI